MSEFQFSAQTVAAGAEAPGLFTVLVTGTPIGTTYFGLYTSKDESDYVAEFLDMALKPFVQSGRAFGHDDVNNAVRRAEKAFPLRGLQFEIVG